MSVAARNVFVGIDAGTTGSKVALFDEHGGVLGTGYADYLCTHPHPGWVEQDVDAVWQGICRASHAARAAANVPEEEIRAIGFSSQRGSFILLDERERPLAPSILWNDSRAQEMEAALAQRIAPARYRSISGMPLSGSWALAKLAWLLRHRGDLMARVRHICNGQEYFLRRLGADVLETDPSSLTLNGMLDIRALDWSDEICQAGGINRAVLPPIGAPGAPVGKLSAAAARETGLPPGTLLCRGGGDQQCAAVGAGVIRQGLAEVTLGTSAMMVAHLDDPSLVTGPVPYIGGHAIPGKWDAEGGAFSIGSCFKWWRDQFAETERARAAEEGSSAYDLLVDLAQQAPAGSRGAFFHPFFAGQVTPYYDAAARGAFFGLGLDHDRACLTRALLEGCACEVRFMVDGIEDDLRGGLSELRMTGGGAQSVFYLQLHADILRRPIVLLRSHECTVLGAAILGAVGSGHFASIRDAVAAMVHVSHTVEPEPATATIYGELFEIFRLAYVAGAKAGVYQRIYDFQRRFF
ncbi:MAG TPA: FGGY family carbohydrate kinase [Casimicrobiaceae bacterium]